MHRLVLMRHARAEPEAAADHARRLSPHGRRDARVAGRLLAGRGDTPTLALVSTAQRARDTWEAVREGLDTTAAEPEVWFDRALYDSGPRAVVELLGAVEAGVATVLVVGHNPTMSVVAAALSDGEAGGDLEERIAAGLSTAACAGYDVPVAWEDVNARRLRLTHLDVPRG
ncbi:MAG: histidine phosphatase family protein [Actinomycetota bacterium]|nr:histidine phosphatase family protein [Actinomycetota bacterium]